MADLARCSLSPLLVATLLATASLPADGAGGSLVYRWVDARGEVHFSDTPPPEAITDVRIMPVTPLPDRAPGDDSYSVVNQLTRMQERRFAAEQARREARMEDREQNYQRQYGWRSWYYGPYAPYTVYSGFGDSYYGLRHPRRRWHSPGAGYPSHPAYRPSGRSGPRHSVGSRNVRTAPHQRLR